MAACDPPPSLEEPEQDVSVIEPGPRGRALAIEYILMELFSYLKPEDLMECRLVNQVWRLMATKAIGPNSPMVHFGRNQMNDLIRFMETVDDSDLRRNKFAVDSGILLGCSPEQKLTMPTFFEKVAPVATHLKITISADFPNLFPQTKSRWNTEYPNLQSLEINSLEDKIDRDSKRFLIDLLGHSPKLESVSIGTDTAGTLGVVIIAVPWHQIRHLELIGEMHRGNFEGIVSLGRNTLQLKSLKLELNGKWEFSLHRRRSDGIDSSLIRRLLYEQCDTLETLKLHFREMRSERIWFHLPRFPKLRKLEIREDAWSLLFCERKLWNKFPMLESFYMSEFHTWAHVPLVFFNYGGDVVIPMCTVKELKFDLDPGHKDDQLGGADDKLDESFARQLIRLAANMFPQVTKLGLPADQRLSKAIQEENVWKDLEELTLFCDHKSSTNSALLENPKLLEDEAQMPAGEPERRIFGFLQQIKTLNFDTGYQSGVGKPCCLSDMTCRSVLLKLPNLKLVNLAALKEHHVSEDVIREMREKVVVLQK